jgi:septum formation protein
MSEPSVKGASNVPRLWLASGSPRRRQILCELGIECEVRVPDVDDGVLRPGATAAPAWTMAMAYLKALSVLDRLHAEGQRSGTVLAADTACEHGGVIMGQPADAAAAGDMLRRMRDSVHRTVTGVCLLDVAGGSRRIFFDLTIVTVGDLSDARIEQYLESGQWRGKAGGYNLAERVEAGWPISWEGDPATVMGLPKRRLLPLLAQHASGSPADRASDGCPS